MRTKGEIDRIQIRPLRRENDSGPDKLIVVCRNLLQKKVNRIHVSGFEQNSRISNFFLFCGGALLL